MPCRLVVGLTDGADPERVRSALDQHGADWVRLPRFSGDALVATFPGPDDAAGRLATLVAGFDGVAYAEPDQFQQPS